MEKGGKGTVVSPKYLDRELLIDPSLFSLDQNDTIEPLAVGAICV